jgi:hypothetical protein
MAWAGGAGGGASGTSVVDGSARQAHIALDTGARGNGHAVIVFEAAWE